MTTHVEAKSDINAEEEHDRLSLLLAHSIGWKEKRKLDTLRARVAGLGSHAIHQALPLVLANPGDDLQKATVRFVTKDYTDGITFLGIDAWSHNDLTKSVRHIGVERRYRYRDFLQAPPVILKEARTLVAVTSLLLSGEVTGAKDNIGNVREGWALNNKELVALVQRSADKGDDIVRIMKEHNTYDVQVIRSFM